MGIDGNPRVIYKHAKSGASALNRSPFMEDLA